MHKQIAVVFATLSLGLFAPSGQQQPEADVHAVMQQYEAAFNKGDGNGIAALFMADGLRVGPSGRLQDGREAIAKSYSTSFAGAAKGGRIMFHPGQTRTIASNVRVLEGTYELAGIPDAAPQGRFLTTLVREDGRWRLASLAAVPVSKP